MVAIIGTQGEIMSKLPAPQKGSVARGPVRKARGGAENDLKGAKDEADKRDSEEALSVPAYYVNTVHVMGGTNIVRVAFGESAPGATRYCTAVALSPGNARTLADTLKRVADFSEQSDSDED
jgi:hypothetical protein